MVKRLGEFFPNKKQKKRTQEKGKGSGRGENAVLLGIWGLTKGWRQRGNAARPTAKALELGAGYKNLKENDGVTRKI